MFKEMRRETGQALLLVLMLLAFGALLIAPALKYTYSLLKLSEATTLDNRALYAVDSAQTVAMWKLLRGGLSTNMSVSGDRISFSVETCDAIAHVTVTMRAVENESGVILTTNYTALPSKTVSPNIINKNTVARLTYTIQIKQVSSNATTKLEYLYDILPKTLFTGNALGDFYYPGSSQISNDGVTWSNISDPSWTKTSTQITLRWPSSGNFTDESFKQIPVAESHYLRFDAKTQSISSDSVFCNWAIAQVGNLPTPSGPQASLIVGNANQDRDLCSENGVYDVFKTSEPLIIRPLITTTVTYTLHITNTSGNTQRIGLIKDILPPGFVYIAENAHIISGGGANTTIKQAYYDGGNPYNGSPPRQAVWWKSGSAADDQLNANGWSMAAGETITMTFRANASQGVSGTYYNEALVYDQGGADLPNIFDSVGLVGGYSTYSWNTGTVIVPAYDSQSTSGTANITANFGLSVNGITLNSWQVK